MQIGTTSPFSQPNALANAFRPLQNEGMENGKNKDKGIGNDADGKEGAVKEKNPIEALQEELAKESEPSALDKLRSQVAKNVLERFQNLQQQLNPLNKSNNPLTTFSNNLKTQEATKKETEAQEKPSGDTENAQKPEDTTQGKPTTPATQNGNAFTIQDLNVIPMTNFQQSQSMSYEANYDKETGLATQEMMYSKTYNFTFSGTIVDKNGNKHNIEANVTLTRSIYTKITGGSDTLDPKVLEELEKGNPFEFAYEGDGSDLKDQNFDFLMDDQGSKDQISSRDSVFGGLIDKAFGEGLGSLLEGLRIFAFGGKENTPTTLPTDSIPNKNENAQDASQPNTLPNDPFGFLNPNNTQNNPFQNLIALGEQGIGMVFLTQMQQQIISSQNGNSLNVSFSSTTISYFDSNKNKETLENLLEKQKELQKKLLEQKEQANNAPDDVKKAISTYKKASEEENNKANEQTQESNTQNV